MGARALTLAGLAALCGAASSSSVFPLPALPNLATYRRLQTGPSGEEVCQGHGYDETTCMTQGCCQWDADTLAGCWSAVGAGPCDYAMAGGAPPCAAELSACLGAPACASILQAVGELDVAACAANSECVALMQCSASAPPGDQCVHVHHIYDTHLPEGEMSCQCVDPNDACLTDGNCVIEPACASADSGPSSSGSGAPQEPDWGQCQTDADACIADSGCLAAMMVTTDTKWRPCLSNKLCRPLWLCMAPPCTPATSPGCALRRFIVNNPTTHAAAHEFTAKAVTDKSDPLYAKLFQ